MNKEKQIIEEMAKHCHFCKKGKCLLLGDEAVDCDMECDICEFAKALYNADYRKQSVGEWVVEAKHFFDDYGDLRVYAIAHCSECKTPYRDNHDVDYERIERPEDLGYYADWSIDIEPIKKKLLERAKTLPLHKYCHECGAKMEGGE